MAAAKHMDKWPIPFIVMAVINSQNFILGFIFFPKVNTGFQNAIVLNSMFVLNQE